jgi:heterodisulfide reductase subunit C
VDLAKVMDAVKIIAQRNKVKAKITAIPIFYRSFLSNLAFFGRAYELGLVVTFKLLTRNFTKDIGLGLRMIRKGKLRILPSFKGALAARRILSKVKAKENQ